MFSGIGYGAEKIGLAALHFPKAALLCIFALIATIGLTLPRVTFDDDIHRVFLSDSPVSQAQLAYEAEQAQRLSAVIIHVSSDTAFTAQDMTTLRNFSLDLEFVDGVTGVASPFVLRWPPQDGAPSGTPVFGPEIPDDFAKTITAFKDLQTGLPTLVNDGLTAMILTVTVDLDQVTISNATASISAELSRALPQSLKAHVTGEDVISAEVVAGLKGDLVALNFWGALIVTFFAILLLRDLRMAAVAVLPALVGAACVLAMSVWLGYPVTVLSNVIPILLLVLGVANGVHLVGHIKTGGTVRGAVETVGPACALTAMTTAIAFASISLTGNAQLFEFATLGALGTLASFVVVLVTFATLASHIPLSQRPIPDASADAAVALTQVGVRYPKGTIAVCVLLLAVSTWGFVQTKSWFPLYQSLPASSPTHAVNNAVADDFGGVFQMIVEVDGGWEEARNVVHALEVISGPGRVLSEVNVSRWLGLPDVQPTPEELSTLPADLTEQLRTKSGASRIFVSTPEPMLNDASLQAFDALHDAAKDAGADRIMGLPTIMRAEAVTLISQLSTGLVLAAFGATLLVALAFRSPALIPVLVIPNVLPLMLTGATLHIWARGELSPTAVLALTISFGIAIDDTVHFLNRYFAAKGEEGSTLKAVKTSAKSAGQVMILTTLLLSAGLAVTLVSDFIPIQLFGGLMIITLWAALLIDLLLLPAMLTWNEKRRAQN